MTVVGMIIRRPPPARPWHVEYLDRHDVQCPAGKALRDWKVKMVDAGLVRRVCKLRSLA